MTKPQMFTTSQVLSILGVARSTLYNWNAEPDWRAPGGRGVLLWKRSTISALAKEHGRIPDWTQS